MTQTPRQGCMYCLAWHQSLPVPLLVQLALALLSPATPQTGGLRRPTRKHAYKSPVCIAPEEGPVPTPRSSRERALGADWLSWGFRQTEYHNRCLDVAQLLFICILWLFWISCIPKHLWMNKKIFTFFIKYFNLILCCKATFMCVMACVYKANNICACDWMFWSMDAS